MSRKNTPNKGESDPPLRNSDYEALASQGFSFNQENPDTNPDALITRKSYLMRTEQFTLPRIYRGSKEWFVEFRFLNPFNEKWDRFRIRGRINYEHDLLKREELAIKLQRELHIQLRAGKTPTRYITLRKSPTALLFPSLESAATVEGLGKGIDTKRNYTLMVNRLKKYFEYVKLGNGEPDKIPIDQLPIEKLNQDNAQEFKEYLMEEMELKNVTVNSTIGVLKFLYKHLLKKRIATIQPFEFIGYLPEPRGTTFIAFDDDEKQRIADHLKVENPLFYLFINFIYSCYIRPKEVCGLTPKDIDMRNGFVQVRIETSKVSHTSFRQMLPQLKQLIIESRVCSLPSNQPIFQAICGNEKNLKIRRRRLSELWKQMIRQDLKIDKEMYGLKHTGNINYLKSLDSISQANVMWLKQQNDHDSLETTQRYIEDLGIYKMKYDKLNFGIL
jgi:integrase